MNDKILSVKNLSVKFTTEDEVVTAVNNLSFEIKKKEIFAIVGESGSGKSVTAQTILGLCGRKENEHINGIINFFNNDKEINILELDNDEKRKIRGRHISMIFQEPMTSLHPLYTIKQQLTESINVHKETLKNENIDIIIDSLNKVQIPNPEKVLNLYPHNLSGGMRQRIMIAMAILFKPKILIADEPTTALDVTIQDQILNLLKLLVDEIGMSIMFITHDMSVVSEMADKILVMKKGQLIENNTVSSIFNKPEHEYTKGLIKAVPVFGNYKKNKDRDSFYENNNEIILSIDNLSKYYYQQSGLFNKKNIITKAVDNVSLKIFKGSTFSLVGESGCGKTTVARCLMNLIKADKGNIFFDNNNLESLNSKELISKRKEIQMIFQDPYASLNPRMPVNKIVIEALEIHKIIKNKMNYEVALNLLNDVKLDSSFLNRYPHELSGGQRQRLCIARALAMKPKLIVADEPISSLDVTIQAQIIDLILELQNKYKLSIFFISHDIAVVEKISHYVGVMCRGKLVEYGRTLDVLHDPQHEYTKCLINSVPTIESNIKNKKKKYSLGLDGYYSSIELGTRGEYVNLKNDHFYLT
tara:strand:+ start:2996 stop:4753 length:1758 start_codon:yes stop_codon:yes gene_type:complete